MKKDAGSSLNKQTNNKTAKESGTNTELDQHRFPSECLFKLDPHKYIRLFTKVNKTCSIPNRFF